MATIKFVLPNMIRVTTTLTAAQIKTALAFNKDNCSLFDEKDNEVFRIAVNATESTVSKHGVIFTEESDVLMATDEMSVPLNSIEAKAFAHLIKAEVEKIEEHIAAKTAEIADLDDIEMI